MSASHSVPNVGSVFSALNPPMDPRQAGRIEHDAPATTPEAPSNAPAVGSAFAALNPPVNPSKVLATPCEAAGKVVTA